MKHQIIFLIGAILTIQLSGCASITHQIVDQLSEESPTLAELDNWKITGKLAIRTPQKAQSINLIWQQQGINYTVKLNGPMGFGATTINGNQQQATIKHGSKILTGTPDQLGLELLGVPLSAVAMSWWIKGLTSPNHAKTSNTAIQEDGFISSLQQNGWQLQFSDHQAQGAFMMPKKISGRRGELSFKLVIKQWDLFHKPMIKHN
jgi:outer membrane lipoprotein LolB